MTDLNPVVTTLQAELQQAAEDRPHDVEARSLMNAAASAIAALEAENVELRKDAVRYRWLIESYFGPELGEANRRLGQCNTAEAMNAAIDAALKETP